MRKRIMNTVMAIATSASLFLPLAGVARAETVPAPNPQLRAAVPSRQEGNAPRVITVPAANPKLQTTVTVPEAENTPRVITVPAANPRLQTQIVVQPANQPAEQPHVKPASLKVEQPADHAVAPEKAAKPAVTANQVDSAAVAGKLRQQGQDKAALKGRLNAVNPSTARAGDSVDGNQVSVKPLVDGGTITLDQGTQGAYAYTQPYMEPNDYAHRNYCGAGAAMTLLGHFDPGVPQNVDIDQIGREINLDPDAGGWVKDITPAVNERLNQIAGQDVNWYRYGEARSLNDLRWIINIDIQQNGVPFITSLNTGGLPGWGSTDVGHIVAVYGYTKMPDGTEYVHYVDTAPSSSGFSGHTFNTAELGQFWQAVSGNTAQVW